MRTVKSELFEIPSNVWQLLTSAGMLMICGNIIQHAFRGMIFPYRSVRIVIHDGTAEKLAAKFTRTVYFGSFSWLVSLIIGGALNLASVFFNKSSLIQLFMSCFGLSSADAYALLASVVLILLTTPIMCLVGACLRKRSGVEYTERMRLRRGRN